MMKRKKKIPIKSYKQVVGVERFYIKDKTWRRKLETADGFFKKEDEEYPRYLIRFSSKEFLSIRKKEDEFRFFLIKEDSFGRKQIVDVGRCPVETFEKWIEPELEKYRERFTSGI